MEKQQEYERVFGYLDKNGDGKISAPELQICVRKIGEELSAEEAEMVAELMDSDGDGLLSMEDLVKVVEAANEEQKVNDLKLTFNMYGESDDDCINNNIITPKSLKRMLSRLGESRSVDDCELMIAEFDLDGNGVLDFHEFQDMMIIMP